MEGLETQVREVKDRQELSCAEKLALIGEMIVRECAKESKLLSVVLDYLLRLRTAGGDPDERVRRRTIRMRHIFAVILIEGKDRGEVAQEVSVKATSELFYALIEAAVFRITVLGKKDASVLEGPIRLLTSTITKPGR